jgi:hypothetical protein
VRIDGRCHCGAIAYEAEVEPDQVFLCHCEDCQVFSGAPFRTRILAPADRFRITRGTTRTYEKTAESGARRTMHFCGTCGTQLYGAVSAGGGHPVSISGGTVRQKAALEPVVQAWCRSRLPWVARLATMPELDRQDVSGMGQRRSST